MNGLVPQKWHEVFGRSSPRSPTTATRPRAPSCRTSSTASAPGSGRSAARRRSLRAPLPETERTADDPSPRPAPPVEEDAPATVILTAVKDTATAVPQAPPAEDAGTVVLKARALDDSPQTVKLKALPKPPTDGDDTARDRGRQGGGGAASGDRARHLGSVDGRPRVPPRPGGSDSRPAGSRRRSPTRLPVKALAHGTLLAAAAADSATVVLNTPVSEPGETPATVAHADAVETVRTKAPARPVPPADGEGRRVHRPRRRHRPPTPTAGRESGPAPLVPPRLQPQSATAAARAATSAQVRRSPVALLGGPLRSS